MGETCVTVTWLQLTRQLLALTGEARYADEIERTLFNHLAAAQRPDGSAWCYYTPLDGYRTPETGISCCVSSGPRAVATVAASVFATTPGHDELAVCLYHEARATVELDGIPVAVSLETPVPFAGGAVLHVDLAGSARFGLRLRRPAWALGFRVDPATGSYDDAGWLAVPARSWRGGDRLDISFEMGLHELAGDGWNRDRVALGWGPLVLAYRAEGSEPAAFDVYEPYAGPALTAQRPTGPWRVRNRLAADGVRPAVLAPFADLGADGGRTRVWLARHDPAMPLSVFQGATESRSSGDPRQGSVADYDLASFASTDDGREHTEEWFALDLDRAVTFRRIEVAHGRSWVHGGWFDASGGRPLIQFRRGPDRGWDTVAAVDGYPATSGSDDGGLRAGQCFEVVLKEAVTATGLRLIGRGAFGEYGPAVFATCAHLAAYLD
jgi:hypothetical protein